MIEKARKVGTGQIIKSLVDLLRCLDSFYPEGSGKFQRNLKQESAVFRILCYKEGCRVCWAYDLEI